MNNKGQTLVIFIILLPIFLFLLVLVVDYGLLSIEKRKVDNNTKDALEYYLSNIDDVDIKNKAINLLKENVDNVEVNIIDDVDFVEIIVKDNYKSIYNVLTDTKFIIKYKGNKQSKEIIKG